MASKDNQRGKRGLSRRDFLKASAAGAIGVGALDWAVAGQALAVEGMTEGVDYDTFHTTCPYCSASCGQVVAVSKGTQGHTAGEVLDLYGDAESPFNKGGLCAKGAGTFQLVTNPRRLGVEENTDPVFTYDAARGSNGIAYKRIGDGAWTRMDLSTAMTEIAAGDGANHTGLVSYRGTVDEDNGYNSKSVAFFGSSHMNNEQNYLYRKIIANFGTTNTEHQARI